MTNKLDVDQRLRIPRVLADFLDEQQADMGLNDRRSVILALLSEAYKRSRRFKSNQKYRERRESPASRVAESGKV